MVNPNTQQKKYKSIYSKKFGRYEKIEVFKERIKVFPERNFADRNVAESLYYLANSNMSASWRK